VIFLNSYLSPLQPHPFWYPLCFPRSFFVHVVVCDATQSSNWLRNYSSLVTRYEAGTELLYILHCTVHRTVRSRAPVLKGLPVCTFRGLTCQHLHPESHTIPTEQRQLLSTWCMRAPAGRCHAVEGRIGVCLSEAQRMGFFTWSLHNLSTAGFLLWRPRFGARLVHVRFLVYEVANGIRFALQVIVIPPKLQSIVCRSLFCSITC
jgi:hypothetical protein